MGTNTMAAIVSVVVPIGFAGAAVVTYSGEYFDQGAGFGNVLHTLTVQNNDSEWGSVLWDGTDDILTGDAKPNSQTRTVEEILAAGVNADMLGIVLNLNEPGNGIDVTLQEFTVVFQDAAGNTLFQAVYDQDTVLEQVGGGVGGAGHLFSIDLSDDEFDQFFGDPTNRLGLVVPEGSPILDTFGGPENFYVVPAPATAVLLGAAGLGSLRRRR